MRTTKIEWTDKTWNPITGCTKQSPGCANCYAEIMSKRLQAMGHKKYRNGFEITLHIETLNEPIFWKKPHTIFVCSMSDLFHDNVPSEFIDKVMKIIEATPQHQYQILTKRAERMREYFSKREIPKNTWLGVTIDVKSSIYKIDYLRSLDTSIKFLSCEPLLEDLGSINLSGINWVIVGGESGNKARPMKEEWVINLQKQTDSQNVLFFFKQWGTWGRDGIKRNKKLNGKLFDGRIIQEMPSINSSNENIKIMNAV